MAGPCSQSRPAQGLAGQGLAGQGLAARKARAQRRRRSPRRQRGVALIIAVVAITLLTVVGAEFAYNSRVDLEMAANSRDELRAYYLARSGVGLSRLLLSFQKQMNNIQLPPGLSQLLGGLGGATGTPGAAGAQPASLNLQLWKMARVDCHMLRGLVPDAPAEADGRGARMSGPELSLEGEALEGAEAPRRSFGSFEGCFLATLHDEEQKINVQRLGSLAANQDAAVRSLLDMMGDKRFEFLWQTEDANRVKANPTEVVLAMRDWLDDDESGAAFNTSAAMAGQGLLAPGFSDENGPYQRFDPRYRAKNAAFDSLDELYRVHGVNDRFMAAFRDRLTVYPDRERGLNINTDDPLGIQIAILAILDPNAPNGLRDPRLQNPLFLHQLADTIKQARMLSFLAMSVKDFAAIIQTAGLAVNPTILQSQSVSRGLSDKSETFSITSVGEAGSVQKTITAVVRIGQNDGPHGRLVYWREE